MKKVEHDLDNSSVIQAIRAGGVSQQRMVKRLYTKYFSLSRQAIREHRGLQQTEAEDAYTDAVLLLRNHILNGQFKGESKWSTYLYSIFQRKCIDVMRQKTTNKARKQRSWEDLPLQLPSKDPDIVAKLIQKDNWKALQACFRQLGESCQQVLMDWGYYGFSMAEIAERHGFKDANTVRSKKHTCLKQLNKLMGRASRSSSVS